MTRLIVFLALIVAFIASLSLFRFKDDAIDNTLISYKTEKEMMLKKQKALYDLENQHAEIVISRQQKFEDEVDLSLAPAIPEKIISIPLDTDELKRGYELYHKKGKCASCHGTTGQGKKSQASPKLAGQFDWYLVKQLEEMKNKIRPNPKMNNYIKNLSSQDFADIAHYLSKLPWQ